MHHQNNNFENPKISLEENNYEESPELEEAINILDDDFKEED